MWTVGVGEGRRERSCFEVEVIYSRRQPSSGVSGVDAALGWGDLWRGQEGETGDETAAADILYTLLQGTSMLFFMCCPTPAD